MRFAEVLERRLRPIVEPQLQEEQCELRPGRVTVDQLMWGGYCGCMGYRDCWYVPFGPCTNKVRAVSVFSAVKHDLSRCWTPPWLSLVTDSVCNLHGQNVKVQPR